MSEPKNKMKLFEEKQVRAVWDEEAEKMSYSRREHAGNRLLFQGQA